MIGAWHPKTESERQLILAQLERIVSDVRFAASNRYPQLLRYIVEQTLTENEDDLKERTLGLLYFIGRRITIAIWILSCVSVRRQVRKRLAEYYQSPAHRGELKIELNPGSYVPVFSRPAPDAPAIEMIPAGVPSNAEQVSRPERTRRNYWPAGLIASGAIIVALFVLGAGYWKQFEKPSHLSKSKGPLSKKSGLRCSQSGKPILFCLGERELRTLMPPR